MRRHLISAQWRQPEITTGYDCSGSSGGVAFGFGESAVPVAASSTAKRAARSFPTPVRRHKPDRGETHSPQ